MKKFSWIGIVLAILIVIGCHPRVKTPKMADGGKFTMLVLLDRGISDTLTPKQVEWRHQVGTWMENDLLRMLKRRGYEASIIKTRDEYMPGGKGNYLIAITILRYNPGSQAARILVGFGAGATSLDVHYELFGESDTVLLSKDDGVGSSKNWTYCARKLNNNIVTSVSKTLH